MILWHLGATVLIVRYVFRDPRMDLRWVLVGSLLPDIIDKPIGSVFFHDSFGTHRLVAHSVVFPIVALAVVLIATGRGSVIRQGLIGAVIGVFVHLLLDAAWATPEAFWWPFFGTEFPHVFDSDIASLLGRMLSDPWVWLGEAAGAGYLVLLWRRYLSGAGEL
ncbi:MAG: metal-dependent hydrolase, partial [Acidimicrobiia bacterium]